MCSHKCFPPGHAMFNPIRNPNSAHTDVFPQVPSAFHSETDFLVAGQHKSVSCVLLLWVPLVMEKFHPD